MLIEGIKNDGDDEKPATSVKDLMIQGIATSIDALSVGFTIDHDSNRDYNNSESVLSGADDTATALWGNNWRMPTKAELQELLSYCDVQWTNVGGVNGRKFTGRGDYASNSVFFPAAGYCCIGYAYGQGNVGYYWSSTPDGSGYAYDLYFYPDFQYVLYDFSFYGFSVRAVLKETVK